MCLEILKESSSNELQQIEQPRQSKVKLTPSVNHLTLETSERGGSDKSDGTILLWLYFYPLNRKNRQITPNSSKSAQTSNHAPF